MKQLKIGDAFSQGWALYKDNFGICVLSTLVLILISGISCGICGGPLLCGLFLILGRLLDKSDPRPTVGDLFKGFDFFLHAFLLCFFSGIGYIVLQTLLSIVPVIGLLIAMVMGWIYGPILIWSLMIITHRGTTWTEAIGTVIRELFNGKFTAPILLGIIAGAVASAGFLLCGIGALFTMPLCYCIYAAAYKQMFGEDPQPEPAQIETAG